MKYFLMICLLLTGITTTWAQETEDDKKKDDDKKNEEKVQSGSRDRLIVELNFVNWAQLDGKQVQTKWYSRGYNFYFMYDIILGKSRFSVAPGLGFGIENAVLEKALYQDTTTSYFVDFNDERVSPSNATDYKKYKLNTVYIDIPLELRFRGKPNARNKSFKMAVGFKGGINIDNHTKLKYEERDKPRVQKNKNYDDIMMFRYGPTFRIGYGAINVVGYYNLGELFKSGGPSGIHPFSVGISINGL